MKKSHTVFYQLLLACLISLPLHAAVIQVSAPNDLKNYLNNMNDGDIIELTTSGGDYSLSAQISVSTEKAITLRAKAGLAVRPKVTFSGTSGYFFRYNGYSTAIVQKKWLFDGIEFDGYNAFAGYNSGIFYYSYVYSPNYGMNVDVNNCLFRNFNSRIFYYQGTGGVSTITTAQGGNLTISNTVFRSIYLGVVYAPSTLVYNPNNVVLQNNYFEGPGENASQCSFVELTKAGYSSFKIDHCTFVNSNKRELQLALPLSGYYIKNSVFVNSYNVSSNNIYNVTLGTDCVIYYTGTGNKNTLYPSSTAARTTDPDIDPATGFVTASAYASITTDGLPSGYFGQQIVCNLYALTDLSYTGVNGPSVQQLITVSAERLKNNLVITPPTNFEISLTSGSSFSSSPVILTQLGGVVDPTIIYVRLKAGLADNAYSGDLTLASVGAVSKTVALSGTVVSGPTIFKSQSTLSGFTYSAGSGPSAQQSIIFNGAGLTSGIQVAAPANFEISVLGGTSFVGTSSLNISQLGGKVNSVTLFVRLKSGLVQNSYSGNLTLTSTGATTQTVSLSGSVTAAPASVTVSKTSISGFSYGYGSGPSAIQSFTVNGGGLNSTIAVTAPTGFEISLTTGTSFVGSSSISLTPTNGTVNVTTLYVRLKSGLSIGTYTGKIQVAATGTTTKEVNLSGTVITPTTVTASVTSMTGFEYYLNAGPSGEKSFDVSGSNLSSFLVLTAPAGYEISTGSGLSFEGSGQLLVDQSVVNVQSVRIYVRMISGLSLGTYTGNLVLSSSGVTSKNVALTGNVLNPNNVKTDPAYYETRYSGALALQNKWLYSRNLGNYSVASDFVAASGMARGMTVKDGKLLFIDRGNKQIVKVNGTTGLKESPLTLAPGIFTYIAKNKAGTADSTYVAGSYTHNDIKTDNAGNVLISNQITANTQRFQIWKIDMATGNGSLLIDQANLATLFPLAVTMRLDGFGVWGDVNSTAIVYAANSAASTMEVYKWTIVNGVAGNPVLIHLDNSTMGTYFTGLESLGGYAYISPVENGMFYVDGGSTYPTLINANGSIADDFSVYPSALKDSVSVPGSMLNMNSGNNGVIEFNVGNEVFLLTSATNTTGIPASAFRLFRFTGQERDFTKLECLWTFPEAGMGATANSYRCATPVVEVNDDVAKIYIYVGENGYGMYELTVNTYVTDNLPHSADVFKFRMEQDALKCNLLVDKLEVFSLNGQKLVSKENTDNVRLSDFKGLYLVSAVRNNIKQISKVMIY